MANNQPPAGGNNMAAVLGNMRPALQNPALANWGAGLQQPMQKEWGFAQQPMQGGLGGLGGQGGLGGLSAAQQPNIMGDMMAQMQAQKAQQGTAAPGAAQPMPRQPMPSVGAPAGGAAGKAPGMKQAIGQLPGGPPMARQRLGGALGNRLRRPGMPLNPQGR